MKRSKVTQLPKEVKAWLDQALIENNFSGYEQLEKELVARGCVIGKSSIHRYGQEFEDRLRAVKLATEQATAIAAASPDDGGAMNDALIRLVQEKAFQALLKMEEGAPLKEIGLMVARLSNATVKQKQWATEVREKAQSVADSVVDLIAKGGMSEASQEIARKKILGIAG
jgi:hypothetical protein